jgi:glycosyltransferase involved in cell wall biosynthesis
MAFKITIIVCTYKRPKHLKKTLLSLIQQTIPLSEFEILVIDNDSKDETNKVVTRISAQHPAANIRYHLEKRKGLSYARNKGIDLSKADIVAFIDDDAIADKRWAEELLKIYEKHKNAFAVGGKVLPIWERTKPEWLKDDYLRNLSLVDWGNEVRPLTWPERIIGTNASFRTEIFQIVSNFNTSLGRQGKNLIGNEDTEIQERIISSGKAIYYTPNAIVHHLVPLERMTKSYFYARSCGNGKSKALLSYRSPIRAIFLEIPYNLFSLSLLYIRLILQFSKEDDRFSINRKIYTRYGFITQSVRLILTKNSDVNQE